MKESEIIVSVIVPIIIGPLFIFFKSLWYRYNVRKEEVRKIQYEENIEIEADSTKALLLLPRKHLSAIIDQLF